MIWNPKWSLLLSINYWCQEIIDENDFLKVRTYSNGTSSSKFFLDRCCCWMWNSLSWWSHFRFTKRNLFNIQCEFSANNFSVLWSRKAKNLSSSDFKLWSSCHQCGRFRDKWRNWWNHLSAFVYNNCQLQRQVILSSFKNFTPDFRPNFETDNLWTDDARPNIKYLNYISQNLE